MTVTHYYGNRNVNNRPINDPRWVEGFPEREGAVSTGESRKGPGMSDTAEWKAYGADQADSGESIFDLDALLDDSDFEVDEPSGKPMMAADNQATRDCGCQ